MFVSYAQYITSLKFFTPWFPKDIGIWFCKHTFLLALVTAPFFLRRSETFKWTKGDANSLGLDMYMVCFTYFPFERNPKRFMFMKVFLVLLSHKNEIKFESETKIDTVYILTCKHMAAKVSGRGITGHQLLRRSWIFQLCRNPGGSNRHGEVTASGSHAGCGWHQVQISTCLGLRYW